MKYRATAAVAASAIALGSLIAGPATAKGAKCVSAKEYTAISVGMTKAKVAKTVGTKGHKNNAYTSDGVRYEVRTYKHCTKSDPVIVVFGDGKVVNKQIGGGEGR